ncbi:MAG: hypothetical protein HFJ09_02350 [Lachnospiraceae bacterium]|nr:hypothetical protein [Lachnospiraceae bacterium]
MTIRNILTEVFEKQCNLYLQLEQYNTEMLLDSITSINNEKFLVEAEWDVADIIPDAGNIEIDVRGYTIFYFIIHDDYFYIKKMKNENDVKDFLIRTVDNNFFTDITIFFDGKIKKYVINHVDDKDIVTWMD